MKRSIGEKWSRKVAVIITIAMSSLLLGVTAFADPTVSVTTDKANAQISDTVTISVKASEPEDDSVAPQIQVKYDPAILEYMSSDVEIGGGGGQLTLSSTNANIQFKALAQGSANVGVEAVLSDDGGSPVTGSTAITVGAAQNTNMSSDATLRALSVSPGTMSPAFSPKTTDYAISVEQSVTDITVSGGVTDEKAQITAASGFKNLKEGENQAIITVTAEDGTTLSYHFRIIRGDSQTAQEALAEAEANAAAQAENEVEAQTQEQPATTSKVTAGATTAGAGVAGFTGGAVTFSKNYVTYQVAQGFDTSLLPQGGLKTDVTVQGQVVQGVTFENSDVTLVYAVCGANGTGDFYIYDAQKNEYDLFVQFVTNGGYIIPIRNEAQAPSGFEKTDMQYNNGTLPAYRAVHSKNAITKDFFLFYAVNENGEYGYYLYDTLEGTYQRYVALGSSGGGLGSSMTSIIIGMMAIIIVGLLMVILNLTLRNKDLKSELAVRKEGMDDIFSAGRIQKKPVKKESVERIQKKKTVSADSDEEAAVERVPQKAPKTVREGEPSHVIVKKQEIKEKKQEVKEKKQIQPEVPSGEMGIQIKNVETFVDLSEEEKEKIKAAELAKEEKKKAARKAALEREIQKDEKARAKEAAAEKKAMEKLLAAEQKLAAKQAAKATDSKVADSATAKKTAAKAPSASAKKPGTKSADRIIVKKEVTDTGVTYTTGRIPVDIVQDGNGKKKISESVPIYNLEKRTVSLVREPQPDQLDDDFELEFIDINDD